MNKVMANQTKPSSLAQSQPVKDTIHPELSVRLRALQDALLTGLVERDVAVRLALLAALAGEHLLLVGPPGTAKSLIARRLRLAFADSTYFERLLTRFTVPEELFGPLSIRGLEEDRYERLTEAYLPTASIAFLDEIFKANSAILNALLTLLNEREFDNGARRVETPIIAVIGASNELPDDEELAALFDRFPLRLHVGPVSKDAFPDLLELRGETIPEIPLSLRLTAADLRAVKLAADVVEVPPDVVALLCDLRDWCLAEEIHVSDRRWRKILKMLQVSALSNGRDQVSVWDCWLLQHGLWQTPAQREKIYEWYADHVGVSAGMDHSQLTRIVVAWHRKLKANKNSRSQMRDVQGRPIFMDLEGNPTLENRGKQQKHQGKDPLYLAPKEAHAREQWGKPKELSERSNGGQGYTKAKLDRLMIPVGNTSYGSFNAWNMASSYLADQENWLMEEVDLPPMIGPTQYKEAYIQQCLLEIEKFRVDVEQYKSQLDDHVTSLEREIRTHLWVTVDFIEPAMASLKRTQKVVEKILSRICKLQQGYKRLPRAFEPRRGS